MAESIRFCLDEHVSRAVAKGLRQRGVDVVTVPEAGMMAADDVSILKLAHQEGWTLFTQDSDFLRLHASGITHAGIVYARQGSSIRDIIAALMLIHEVLGPDEMHNHVEFV